MSPIVKGRIAELLLNIRSGIANIDVIEEVLLKLDSDIVELVESVELEERKKDA